MITIKDFRVKSEGVPFSSLAIGQGYEDERNNICIKTSHCSQSNCIYWDDGSWSTSSEGEHTEVFPLNMELKILP
jgi:hypothetical protein